MMARENHHRDLATTSRVLIKHPEMRKEPRPQGARALPAPLKRESIEVSYAKHTTRYDELYRTLGGSGRHIIATA
jgi:hypothetical protein